MKEGEESRNVIPANLLIFLITTLPQLIKVTSSPTCRSSASAPSRNTFGPSHTSFISRNCGHKSAHITLKMDKPVSSYTPVVVAVVEVIRTKGQEQCDECDGE